MEIIILFIILVVAGFIIRALFNTEWRNSAQEKIDAVKKERVFWRLVNGYQGMNLDIEAIFTVHLDLKHFGTFIGSGNARSEDDEKILKLIRHRGSFGSINVLNDNLEEVDKVIIGILSHSTQQFTKAEIKKFFESRKDERLLMPAQYDKFMDFYMRFLPDQAHLKDADLWATRKKLSEVSGKLEWKTDEEKVDAETIFAIRKSEVEVGEVVGDILCGKDGDKDILRTFVTNWEHMQMLRSCVVDLAVPWHNTNLIQRFMWKIVAGIAS
ncbi:MAG: hypothetical protein M3M85_02910 [bacterium]|nr:hypothetical protein [bacterium]